MCADPWVSDTWTRLVRPCRELSLLADGQVCKEEPPEAPGMSLFSGHFEPGAKERCVRPSIQSKVSTCPFLCHLFSYCLTGLCHYGDYIIVYII